MGTLPSPPDGSRGVRRPAPSRATLNLACEAVEAIRRAAWHLRLDLEDGRRDWHHTHFHLEEIEHDLERLRDWLEGDEP